MCVDQLNSIRFRAFWMNSAFCVNEDRPKAVVQKVEPWLKVPFRQLREAWKKNLFTQFSKPCSTLTYPIGGIYFAMLWWKPSSKVPLHLEGWQSTSCSLLSFYLSVTSSHLLYMKYWRELETWLSAYWTLIVLFVKQKKSQNVNCVAKVKR